MRTSAGLRTTAGALAALLLAGCGEKEAAPKAWQPTEEGEALLADGPANMVEVPAGEYTIGDNKWKGTIEPKAAMEYVERPVSIPKGFRIDRYEVTNGMYMKFLESLGPDARKKHTPRKDEFGKGDAWKDGRHPSRRGNYPVRGVTLEDARAYAAWRGGRLPTPDEWEVAARGTGKNVWAFGSAFDPQKCNTVDYWKGKPENPAPLKVGSFEAGKSPFGCYDMTGNVAEWTDKEFVTRQAVRITTSPAKGGSYMQDRNAAESSNKFEPSITKIRPDLGFRCVKD